MNLHEKYYKGVAWVKEEPLAFWSWLLNNVTTESFYHSESKTSVMLWHQMHMLRHCTKGRQVLHQWSTFCRWTHLLLWLILYCSMVVQWFTRLPHSKEVQGSIPGSGTEPFSLFPQSLDIWCFGSDSPLVVPRAYWWGYDHVRLMSQCASGTSAVFGFQICFRTSPRQT